MRSRNEAGAAVTVGVLEIGARRKRHLEDFDPALRGGVEVGRILDKILGVDVGALLDQEARNIDAVAVGGGQKRRAAALIASIDPRAVGEQPSHHRQLATLGGGNHLAFFFIALLRQGLPARDD